MRVLSLFELLLALFGFYALLTYEAGKGMMVPVLCLCTLYLFEKLRQRIKEDEEARKRLLRYEEEDSNKDGFDEVISSE
jgi:hypothetical protein